MAPSSKYLAEDLAAEILARLPAKSLVRFKCVARSWNALFGTRSFVDKHASSSSSSSRDDRLLIFHTSPKGKICATLFCDDPLRPPRPVEFPFGDKRLATVRPYGPCNGVYCLHRNLFFHQRWEVILWNPATREVKVVPPPHHYGSIGVLGLEIGFGIDPKTYDYKVVSILLGGGGREPRPNSVEVYSLNTDSWTSIDDTTVYLDELVSTEYYTHAKGVCHWLNGYSARNRTLLCLDLTDHKFRELKLPLAFDHGSEFASPFFYEDIAQVNDSIAYFVQYYDRRGSRFDIWVLDDDGVGGNNWTKRHSLGLLPGLSRFYGVWKGGGEVLAAEDEQPLVSYTSDARPVRRFEINVGRCYYFRVYRYVETMASFSV